MTYREQLNKVNELGINICDLTIANELDYTVDEITQMDKWKFMNQANQYM